MRRVRAPGISKPRNIYGSVAQLAERLAVNQNVESSSLSVPSSSMQDEQEQE